MIDSALLYMAAAGAIARRDLTIFMSYRTQFATLVFGLAFQASLFYYVSRLIDVGPEFTSDSYYAFAVIGLAGLQVMSSTLNVAAGVQRELAIRSFERIVLSPFGAPASTIAMLAFPLLQAMLLGTLAVVIGGLLFGMDIAWATAPLALPVALLGALALAPFGLFFAGLAIVFKQAPGRAMVLAMISFAAGVYFPVAILPDWIRWVADVQPLTPTLDLVRHLVVGLPLENPAWQSVLKLFGFVVVLFPIGILGVVVAARAARRRGTVLEY